jgi:hypothetical protein
LKRIDFPAKRCAFCREILYRKRSPSGRIEDSSDFHRRRLCGNACKGGFMTRTSTTRNCKNCGAQLERRRHPSGLEPRANWMSRRFCSRLCVRLWRSVDRSRFSRGPRHAQAMEQSVRWRNYLRRLRLGRELYGHRKLDTHRHRSFVPGCVFCHRVAELTRDHLLPSRLLKINATT